MISTLGTALQSAGFTITPCRGKAPVLSGWQSRGALSAAELRQHGACNVGLVLGVAPWFFIALDIDATHAGWAEACERLATARWGVVPVRVGRWPKRLVLLRVGEGVRKWVGPWLEDMVGDRCRLEVLGQGQQCVVAGMHPDTGAAYQWTDMVGGLGAEGWAPGEVPLTSWSEVEAWCGECLREAAQWGLEASTAPLRTGTHNTQYTSTSTGRDGRGNPRDPMETYAPPLGLSIAEARDVLWKGGGDPGDYDAWLRAGMALHHESGGWGEDGWAEGLQLWLDWSRGAANFESFEDLERRWEGFGRSVAAGGRPVTLKYAVAACSAATREAESVAGGSVGDYPRTERGNAQRLLDRWGRDLLYCSELGQWYRWSGIAWRAASLTEIRHLARSVVDDMRGDVALCTTDREKGELMKWCAVSQKWTMYDHMVSIASLDAGLWVRASELDGDKRYLGVQNGVVDLWTGQLLPPDRARRVTRLCSVAYRPDATCALFEQQIKDVFGGDMELVGFWWRFMGYCLQGNPVEDVVCLNIGNGNNGKSTTMQPVVAVLGDYATTAPASLFLRDGPGIAGGAGGARPDLLALAGRRLVLVNEPDEGGELREGLVKAMTGGESMPARALYSSVVVQVTPTWVVVMSTNHKPIIRGEDKGIWRRLLPVPWERDFDVGGAKDAHREEKLMGELEGILATLVRGGLDYRRVGLAVPSRVDGSRREYRGEMDLLADWLSERCIVGAAGGGDSVSLDALWLDWEPWARVRGELRFVSSRKALAKRLRNRGLVAEKTMKGLQVVGVRLRQSMISED